MITLTRQYREPTRAKQRKSAVTRGLRTTLGKTPPLAALKDLYNRLRRWF
jgi:hypothetical protein